MPKSVRKLEGEAGRAILRSLLARLRDDRQVLAVTQELEEAECRLFLREYENFHAELKERDPQSYVELEDDRRGFDGAMMDGLQDE